MITVDAEFVLESSFAELAEDLVKAGKQEGPVSDEILRTLHASVDLLAQLIADNTPVNTGVLAAAIGQSKDISYGDGVWSGMVSDGGIAYGAPVEFGRKAGKQPPVDDLKLWIIRTQMQWYRDLASGKRVKMTADQMAWALAKHIQKHGTEGAFMFKKGWDAAMPQIEQLWNGLMDEIEQIWRKGGV